MSLKKTSDTLLLEMIVLSSALNDSQRRLRRVIDEMVKECEYDDAAVLRDTLAMVTNAQERLDARIYS
jgi:protein-arginine kinase activator protein McsA